MAFGQHWEWRGFGRVSDDLQARIEALELRFASDEPIIDTYLWTPSCRTNVKLRYGDLKFKYLLEADGDLQHWLEDENDIYPFPLEINVVKEMEQALAISLPEDQQMPVGRNELLEILQSTVPPTQIVLVEKIRRFFSLHTAVGEPVIVELTDLSRPEPIQSIALEHANVEAVRLALAELDMANSELRPRDYLHALSIWAAGERLFPG